MAEPPAPTTLSPGEAAVSSLLAILLLPLLVRLPLCLVSRAYVSAAPPGQSMLFPLVYGLVLLHDVVRGPVSFAALGLAALGAAWWRPGRLLPLVWPAFAASAVALLIMAGGLAVAPGMLPALGLAARLVELVGLAYASFNAVGLLLGVGRRAKRLLSGAAVVVPAGLLGSLVALLPPVGSVGCPLPAGSPAAQALAAVSGFSLTWLAARLLMLLVAWKMFKLMLRA